jgi:hypothetical protein
LGQPGENSKHQSQPGEADARCFPRAAIVYNIAYRNIQLKSLLLDKHPATIHTHINKLQKQGKKHEKSKIRKQAQTQKTPILSFFPTQSSFWIKI